MKTMKPKPTFDDDLSFEKARFDYCWKIYEEENQRKDTLEKKSQFYLSFITLILGGRFLNIDFVETLQQVLAQGTTLFYEKLFVLLPLVFLSLSLVISLVAIFMTLQVREYSRPYPANTITCYFDPGIKYFENNTAASLFRITATDITIALEVNRGLNDKKSRWVKISSASLIVAIFSLAVFLTVVIVFILP